MSSRKDLADSSPLVQIVDAVKTYGPTRALSGVTLDVHAGEVLGIVGHNGAGKSTLMRVLSGLEELDSGTINISDVMHSAGHANRGVRMAYQETSLASELTVAHNIYMSSGIEMPKFNWHDYAAKQAKARLSDIFPGNAISPDDYVDDIPLADRQMVEITRATLADGLRLLILDEPTESLTGETATLLYTYVRKLAKQGVAILLVSHRLHEILDVSNRVAVMKDGAVVSVHQAKKVSEDDLFVAMGGEVAAARGAKRAHDATSHSGKKVTAELDILDADGKPTKFVAYEGEVVGLAGIAGQGQEQVLQQLWAQRSTDGGKATMAFVPGDRQRAGILPLWDVAGNLTVTALRRLARFGWRDRSAEASVVSKWISSLKIKGGERAAVTGLSGGNQQKVIVARAFASRARTILLDDPFRGVDIHTKIDLYELIRAQAKGGRTIIWYSSENSEMQHCDRAYVIRAKRVAGILTSSDISDDRIIALSFVEAGSNQ